ncbi:Bicarbonate transporter [Parasponia andersonii]|uniref:Bicarbonate transporter n=1 Tax=Parasponia andersonii TaxID=3476 RepID=A0A2P5DBI5_PARAD|nr:Bicarbonate transporter [Parasponia andersonii]
MNDSQVVVVVQPPTGFTMLTTDIVSKGFSVFCLVFLCSVMNNLPLRPIQLWPDNWTGGTEIVRHISIISLSDDISSIGVGYVNAPGFKILGSLLCVAAVWQSWHEILIQPVRIEVYARPRIHHKIFSLHQGLTRVGDPTIGVSSVEYSSKDDAIATIHGSSRRLLRNFIWPHQNVGFIANYGVPLMVGVWTAVSYGPGGSLPKGVLRRLFSPNPWLPEYLKNAIPPLLRLCTFQDDCNVYTLPSRLLACVFWDYMEAHLQDLDATGYQEAPALSFSGATERILNPVCMIFSYKDGEIGRTALFADNGVISDGIITRSRVRSGAYVQFQGNKLQCNTIQGIQTLAKSADPSALRHGV